MTVSVTLPRMLAGLVGDERSVVVDGRTVGEVLDAVFAAHPVLRVHVLDEGGTLRPHVRCFRNDAVVDDLALRVTDGDVVTVVQAVSGG